MSTLPSYRVPLGSRDKRVPSPIEEVSEEINDSSNPLSQLWSEVQISDWVARQGNVASRYERRKWGGGAYINHTLHSGENARTAQWRGRISGITHLLCMM